MQDIATEAQVGEEAEDLPPFPDWPVLMHVGRYRALRFVCPHDERPMENETAMFSLRPGRYSCSGGHVWESSPGEWHGHRVTAWSEIVAALA